MANPDFEALYSSDPGKIRANANLPGHLVYCVTKLTNHASLLQATRAALEKEFPGYGHKETCQPICTEHWTWRDFGVPDGWNPTLELITPYLQYSRAEAMKGSEQVVRSFQGARATDLEGVGLAPDLTPRQRQDARPAPMVIVAAHGLSNGVKEAKESTSLAKRLIGLGGR
jgi:hypothetical protein